MEPTEADPAASTSTADVSSDAPQAPSMSGPFDRLDLATVALRIIAIFLFFAALPIFSTLYYVKAALEGMPGAMGLLLVNTVPYAVPLAIGLWIWRKAPRWGEHLLPRINGERRVEAATPGQELQAIAFSVVGLVMVLQAVRYLAEGMAIYQHVMVRGVEVQDLPFWLIVRPSFIPAGICAAGGAWLFFGSKHLAAYWHRIRHPEMQQRHEDS